MNPKTCLFVHAYTEYIFNILDVPDFVPYSGSM